MSLPKNKNPTFKYEQYIPTCSNTMVIEPIPACYILGIETSCDETGVAIYGQPGGLLAQALYSQVALHAEYGGVVPELASRDHIRKLLPLTEQVLSEANLTPKDIQAIAYTAGPGLMGALLVGAAFARSLGFAWGIPTLGIHHMEGHLCVPMIDPNTLLEFPFLALLVSGGHTLLVSVQDLGEYHILGETLDDAVGEAFDKTAKLLGLPYPGGAQLSALARTGNSNRFYFPRPLLKKPGLDFSFSGLKTCAANTLRSETLVDEQTKADIARAFEDAVIETLWRKCLRALKQTGLTRLVVAGGVSANQPLKKWFQTQIELYGGKTFFPSIELCTDNGAMIAYAGYLRFCKGQRDTHLEIDVKPRWSLEELTL